MFVAFMPVHILLCDEVLLYLIYVNRRHLNLNLNQMILQMMKRFENKTKVFYFL
jgi:hypothetical protein